MEASRPEAEAECGGGEGGAPALAPPPPPPPPPPPASPSAAKAMEALLPEAAEVLAGAEGAEVDRTAAAADAASH
jgi:hypothetical protein